MEDLTKEVTDSMKLQSIVMKKLDDTLSALTNTALRNPNDLNEGRNISASFGSMINVMINYMNGYQRFEKMADYFNLIQKVPQNILSENNSLYYLPKFRYILFFI